MLDDIEIFCAIVKAQSFNKAARDLQLSPSIVTRRLARLEKQLKTRLFQRTTRRLMITEAGQRYYDAVHDLLQALTSANNDIKQLSEEVTGTLKVGMPVSISHRYVSRHLHALLAQYPALNVQIVNGNHLLDLLDNGFNCIVHCGPLPDVSFHYKKITAWKKIICASPDYLAKHGIPKKPEDLQQHNCLDHIDNFNYTWLLHERGKSKSVAVNGNVRINSSIDLCNLAVSGLGIAYLPSFTVTPELQKGELISILEKYQPPPLDMFVVYPSKQYLGQKTRIFIEFINDLFN